MHIELLTLQKDVLSLRVYLLGTAMHAQLFCLWAHSHQCCFPRLLGRVLSSSHPYGEARTVFSPTWLLVVGGRGDVEPAAPGAQGRPRPVLPTRPAGDQSLWFPLLLPKCPLHRQALCVLYAPASLDCASPDVPLSTRPGSRHARLQTSSSFSLQRLVAHRVDRGSCLVALLYVGS